jgi:hypothetical protein
MAKICVLNTGAITDSAGLPFDSVINGKSEAAPVRTKPVRLFSGEGETRYCAWEFIFTGNPADSADLRFYSEFWSDKIPNSLAAPPNLRMLDKIDNGVTWAREVDEVVGAGGAITHNAIVRTLTMTVPTGGVGIAYYLPMLYHASWVRLAVWPSVEFANGDVRIYAHVGGHTEDEYLESIDSIPYAYNA